MGCVPSKGQVVAAPVKSEYQHTLPDSSSGKPGADTARNKDKGKRNSKPDAEDNKPDASNEANGNTNANGKTSKKPTNAVDPTPALALPNGWIDGGPGELTGGFSTEGGRTEVTEAISEGAAALAGAAVVAQSADGPEEAVIADAADVVGGDHKATGLLPDDKSPLGTPVDEESTAKETTEGSTKPTEQTDDDRKLLVGKATCFDPGALWDSGEYGKAGLECDPCILTVLACNVWVHVANFCQCLSVD